MSVDYFLVGKQVFQVSYWWCFPTLKDKK